MTGQRDGHSRRQVLETAAAAGSAGLVASLAGCQQVKDAVGLGKNRTKQLPEDAETAFYVDVQATLNDEATKELANAVIDKMSEREGYDGPADWSEAKEKFQEQAELDPSKGKWSLTFSEIGGSSSGQYRGTLFKGDWSEDDVVSSLEENNDAEYDESDHEGKTIYEPSKDYYQYLGVISDNKFVTGSEDAVEDAIEVAAAGGDKMAEELRNAYGNTRDAPVKYVSEWTTSGMSETTTIGGEEIDVNALEDVEHVAGAIFKNGDERGLENTLTTEDEDQAADVADVLEAVFGQVAEGEDAPTPVRTMAGDVQVSQDGSDVTVTYEAPIDDLKKMLEQLMEASMGTGERSGGGSEENVRAGASVEHDRDSNTITVTWTSNQNADRLYVSFRAESGESDAAYIQDVGGSAEYECQEGDSVDVGVTAIKDDNSTPIIRKQLEC
jgi:hypothetical protein